MSDFNQSINNMLQELKQKRDELQVQVHLAKLEANDEWKTIQGKLEKVELKAKELSKATVESSSEIASAAQLLGQEIREGFKKIVKHF